jgi:hypothetical protein
VTNAKRIAARSIRGVKTRVTMGLTLPQKR